MKIRITYIKLYIFAATLLSFSCVKDLDFGQLEEVRLTPIVEADFIYSTFDMEENIPEGLPPNTEFEIGQPLRDTINYDLVGNEFAVENIERVELTIEISNQIERGFELQFQFLTENDEPLGQLYQVPVAPGNGPDEPAVISFSVPDPIVIDNATIRQLQNAQKIAAQLVVPTLNTDLRGILKLRSKAVYYINYAP